MPIDPRKLKPGELIRLMNSTPMGAVLNETAFQKHRLRAGLRISAAGDQNKIDVFRYVAWLASNRAEAMARVSLHKLGTDEFAEMALAASRKLSVSQLAQVLGVHVNAVKYHTERGLPYSNDGRGIRRYNEKECRRWLAEKGSVHYNGGNRLGAYAAGPNGEDPDSEKNNPDSPLNIELRLKKAKIAEIEIKNDRANGVLVNAADLASAFNAHLASVRRAFEALPARASSKAVAAAGIDHTLQGQISDAIKECVDDAMMTLSAWRGR